KGAVGAVVGVVVVVVAGVAGVVPVVPVAPPPPVPPPPVPPPEVGAVTVNVCWACSAGAKVVSPAWFALITQLPAATKLTVAAVSWHTELADAPTVNTTGKPELALAATV